MHSSFLSSDDLLGFLDTQSKKDDTIRRGESFFVAAIKEDGRSSVSVCLVGIGEWVSVPLKMIEAAKIVGEAVAGSDRYPVALIKMREPDDPVAKIALQLLTQVNTITKAQSSGGGCGCGTKCGGQGTTQNTESSAARVRRTDTLGPFLPSSGTFGLGKCRFQLRCYECERCVPWTDLCWTSTCCDLERVDCEVGY